MLVRGEKTLRSDFLVHWTGAKKIEKEYKDPKAQDYQDRTARVRKYIDRIRTTFEGGLWMNDIDIELHSSFDGGEVIHFSWPATCFTEIKLSNVVGHAERYGYLGFGFSRQFVMERFGAPVLYVPGVWEFENGAKNIISQRFVKLIRITKFFESYTVEVKPLEFPHGVPSPIENCAFTDFIKGIGLSEFLKQSCYGRDAERPWLVFQRLSAALISCASFIKTMSDKQCSHRFEYLDEAEWRIPYTDLMVEKGRIHKTGMERPRGKIVFTQRDLKVLILPDDETRRQALDEKSESGKYIVDWLFSDPANVPIVATVDECLQF